MATDERDEKKSSDKGDLRSMLRSIVSPLVEQFEPRVTTQIDDEVTGKVDELLATRMATVDRAIGDLDRHLAEMNARLDRLELELGAIANRLDTEIEPSAIADED